MESRFVVHVYFPVANACCLEANGYNSPSTPKQAKCITETENVVKIVFRSVSKQQLIDAGVARAACRML